MDIGGSGGRRDGIESVSLLSSSQSDTTQSLGGWRRRVSSGLQDEQNPPWGEDKDVEG